MFEFCSSSDRRIGSDFDEWRGAKFPIWKIAFEILRIGKRYDRRWNPLESLPNVKATKKKKWRKVNILTFFFSYKKNEMFCSKEKDEHEKENSVENLYREFFRAVPREFSTPLYYSDSELNLLKGLPIYGNYTYLKFLWWLMMTSSLDEVVEKKSQLRKTYDLLFPKLFQVLLRKFQEKYIFFSKILLFFFVVVENKSFVENFSLLRTFSAFLSFFGVFHFCNNAQRQWSSKGISS